MDSSKSSYKYRPLTEPGAIRLIELPPSEDPDTRLECTLIHTTFNEINDEVVYHYCALSYVWGDAKDKKSVVVDGQEFHITTNLEKALRYLRDPSLVRYIWADAICINQNDNAEKAIQVSQMGEVYKAARHTIIWLDDGTEQDEAEHMLASIRDAKKESQGMKATGRSDISQTWPGQLGNQLLSLECLTSLPWFSRVWIYQELIVSSDPWLQVRRTRARWADVSMIVSSCLKNMDGLSEPCNRFLAMDKARKDFHVQLQKRSRSKKNFYTLVPRRGLGLFDARDMIFAHLGIVSESPLDVSPDEWDRIRADYKKDCSELYRNVAYYLSMRIDIFKMLSHVEAASDQRYPETPSWAPNWMVRPLPLRCGRLSDSIDTLRKRYGGKHHLLEDSLDASNGSLLLRTLPESYKVWLDMSTISFLGFHMGNIAQLSTVIAYDDASLDPKKWFKTTPQSQGDLYNDSEQKVYNRWWDIFSPLLKDKSKYDTMFQSAIAIIRAHYRHDLTLTDDDIFIHILLHEFRPNDSAYPHFLYGRRLALVPGCGFAVVPSSARIGDVTCFFLERTTVPFLLRPIPPTNVGWIDSKIRNTFKPRIPGKSLPVHHFELVGECVLQNLIFSSLDGWYFADLSGEHYPGILEAFVIH